MTRIINTYMRLRKLITAVRFIISVDTQNVSLLLSNQCFNNNMRVSIHVAAMVHHNNYGREGTLQKSLSDYY